MRWFGQQITKLDALSAGMLGAMVGTVAALWLYGRGTRRKPTAPALPDSDMTQPDIPKPPPPEPPTAPSPPTVQLVVPLPYRVLNRVLLVLLGVGSILLLLEFGVRFYFVTYGTEDERIRYVYSGEEIQRRTAAYRGLPYLNFGLEPDHPQHNSLGYRGPEIIQPKPEGVFRIVALGGSTTYSTEVENYEDSYPTQLEAILREDYGYSRVEVINAGVPSYGTWETLVNLQFRALDLDPDLLIVYHATNDVTFRLVAPEHYNSLNTARGIWDVGQVATLTPFTLVRYLGINLGWMKDPSNLRTQFAVIADVAHCSQYVRMECAGYPVRDLLELNPPIYFERNLRNIIHLAQANDIPIMLASWAYFPEPMENGTFNIYVMEWRREAVAEHNAIIARVASELGAAYYDFVAEFPYNRDFWEDGVHHTPEGNTEKARLFAAFIHAQGWIE